MILADTSVWVDHLRHTDPAMQRNLATGNVATHPMVVGELACGNLPRRKETLVRPRALPQAKALDDDAVLTLIESKGLMGRGIGFVDVHLLGAVLAGPTDTQLWTRDKRLHAVAETLGAAYFETESGVP